MINTANDLLLTSRVNSAVKLASLITAGGIATFSLFVVMSKLVEDKASYQKPLDKSFQVSLLGVRDDTNTHEIVKSIPQPPVVKPMPKPVSEPKSANTNDDLQIAGDEFEMHEPNVNTAYLSSRGQNFSAMPVVRVPPDYPQKAAIDGIEGWVNLSFAVDKVGNVVNVEVVDAKPKRIFNAAAKKALKKWKYKPKMVNGQAVMQEDQFVVLEFKLKNH